MSVGAAVPWGDPSKDRAQTEVIGVVLLVGMVSIAALGLMLVASGAVSDSEGQAEKERVEQSFVQLSHTMASASTNGNVPKSIEFDAGESGAITKTNAGNITIKGGNLTELDPLPIGAIEYEHEDGTIVAYQAGGVWAEQGNKTRMISAPPVNYDASSETLTLPISTVSEDQSLNSGSIAIGLDRTDPVKEASIIENGSVEMTIQSPYYRGWEKYFRTQGGAGVVRNVDHTNNSVTVKFGPLEFEDALSRGATYSEEPGGSHSDEIEEDGAYGTMRLMDETINGMIEDARDDSLDIDRDYGRIDSNTHFSNGTYLVDSIEGGSHSFDLTSGNITLLVDGDIESNGVEDFMTVTGHTGNNQLKIYTTGNLDIQNGGNICVDPCDDDVDSSIIQLYGTSETSVSINQGNPRYEGIIYAASDKESWDYGDRRGACDSDEYQVAFQANADFTGSLIAASICGQSNSYDFSYDNSLQNANIDPYPEGYAPPPRITYLNVAIHHMDVTNR